MSTDEPAANGTNWRLRSLEHRVNRLEEVRPDVISERVDNHAREIAAVRETVESLRRSLYVFSFSIAASSIGFGIAVLQLTR